MSSQIFWRTVISGFIATFVMAIIAFLQGGLHLPVIDVGHILRSAFNHVHAGEPYSILWGNIAYFIVGILLALIWVAFFQQRTSFNWLINGLMYGLLISLIAGLVVSPLAARAAGDSIGIFYSDTWFPGKILIAGMIIHLAYGLTLMLCLKVANIGKL